MGTNLALTILEVKTITGTEEFVRDGYKKTAVPYQLPMEEPAYEDSEKERKRGVRPGREEKEVAGKEEQEKGTARNLL